MTVLDALSPFGEQGFGYRKHIADALTEMGIDPELTAEELKRLVLLGKRTATYDPTDSAVGVEAEGWYLNLLYFLRSEHPIMDEPR